MVPLVRRDASGRRGSSSSSLFALAAMVAVICAPHGVAAQGTPGTSCPATACTTGYDCYTYTNYDATAYGICVGGGACAGDADCQISATGKGGTCAQDDRIQPAGGFSACVCDSHHIGPLCQDCEEGYTLDATTGECVRCPDSLTNPCNENELFDDGTASGPAGTISGSNTCAATGGAAATCTCGATDYDLGVDGSCHYSGTESGFVQTGSAANEPTQDQPVVYVNANNDLVIRYFYTDTKAYDVTAACPITSIEAEFLTQTTGASIASASGACSGVVKCVFATDTSAGTTCAVSITGIDTDGAGAGTATAAVTAEWNAVTGGKEFEITMPMEVVEECGFDKDAVVESPATFVNAATDDDTTYSGSLLVTETYQCVSDIDSTNALDPTTRESEVELIVVYPYAEESMTAVYAYGNLANEFAANIEVVDASANEFDFHMITRVNWPYQIKDVRLVLKETAAVTTDPVRLVQENGATFTSPKYSWSEYANAGATTPAGTILRVSDATWDAQTANARTVTYLSAATGVPVTTCKTSDGDIVTDSLDLSGGISAVCESSFYFSDVAALHCDETLEVLVFATLGCVAGATDGTGADCDAASIDAQEALWAASATVPAYGDTGGDAVTAGAPVYTATSEVYLGSVTAHPTVCPDAFTNQVTADLSLVATNPVVAYIPGDKVEFDFKLHAVNEVLDDYYINYCVMTCSGATTAATCEGTFAATFEIGAGATTYGSTLAVAGETAKFTADGGAGAANTVATIGLQLTIPATATDAFGIAAGSTSSTTCVLTVGAAFDGNLARRRLAEVSRGLRGAAVGRNLLDVPTNVKDSVKFTVVAPAETQGDASSASSSLPQALFGSASAAIGAMALMRM